MDKLNDTQFLELAKTETKTQGNFRRAAIALGWPYDSAYRRLTRLGKRPDGSRIANLKSARRNQSIT